MTNDIGFLEFYRAELIPEIARYWSSIASFNPKQQRYEIHGVMGPDEFHDARPDSVVLELNDNAYTT